MNGRLIATLVAKDLKLYFKNRFFAFVTILALVGYSVIYLVLPAELDESLELNLYAPTLPDEFAEEMAQEGIDIHLYDRREDLETGIEAGDFAIGIALPENYASDLAAGNDVNVVIYFASDFPEEFRDFWVLFIRETSFTLAGKALNVEVTETVLGHDLIGEQIAGRDRMLPLLAVFILMMETMGLASLITSEVEGGTLRALLITPLTVTGLFMSKGIMGTGLAFAQASILLLVTGGFSQEPLIMVTAILIGGLMATGLGLMIASVARDMMSVMGWSVFAILLLALPTFNIILPGSISTLVEAIPSFYLADTVHQVLNFGASWPDVGQNLAILLGFSILFFGLGIVMLRRKFS
jgi:ABC-2 type transport system permease protein